MSSRRAICRSKAKTRECEIHARKSIEMYTRGKKVQCHIYIVFCFDAKRLSSDYEDKNKVFKFLKSPNIFVEWQQ